MVTGYITGFIGIGESMENNVETFERIVKTKTDGRNRYAICVDHKTLAVYCDMDHYPYLADRARSVIPGWDVTFHPYTMGVINHPSHYGGDTIYEAIKVIEAWALNFNLGNTVKYISRAGKKTANILEDLEKASWYLQREIEKIKNGDRPS